MGIEIMLEYDKQANLKRTGDLVMRSLKIATGALAMAVALGLGLSQSVNAQTYKPPKARVLEEPARFYAANIVQEGRVYTNSDLKKPVNVYPALVEQRSRIYTNADLDRYSIRTEEKWPGQLPYHIKGINPARFYAANVVQRSPVYTNADLAKRSHQTPK